MNKQELPIAVFDSGVGGISVLRELVRLLPREHFLYFGDSANAPYGVRPTEEVRDLTLKQVGRLLERGVKAVVIACNTATSAAIEALRSSYPQEIIVGIEPAVKLAAELRPVGRILVMATDVTLREQKFHDLTLRFSGKHPVEAVHCPGLVELIEQGEVSGPRVTECVARALKPMLAEDVTAIVLGCTHYPFVRKTVEAIAGPSVSVIDGGLGTAKECRRRLGEAGLLRETGEGAVCFENSANCPQLLALMDKLLKL